MRVTATHAASLVTTTTPSPLTEYGALMSYRFTILLLASLAIRATAADDAYTPLRLYDGGWESTTSGSESAKVTHLVNHCERTGLFFVCEQIIDGVSKDLVVFLPTDSSGVTHHYRTNALSVDASTPGNWGKLEIAGERWVYTSDSKDGASAQWRTVNVFSGPDHIHFEIQRSTDGHTWETTRAGDERRVAR